jgi:hypothetical protein
LWSGPWALASGPTRRRSCALQRGSTDGRYVGIVLPCIHSTRVPGRVGEAVINIELREGGYNLLLVVDRTRSHHLLVVEAGALLQSMCAEHGVCGSAPVRLWRVVVLTASTSSPPRQALFVPALVITCAPTIQGLIVLILPGYQFTRVPDRAARSRGRDHQACCSFCSHGADAAAVGQTGVGPLWRAVVRAAVTTQVVRVDALRLVFVDFAQVLPVLLLFHRCALTPTPCLTQPPSLSLAGWSLDASLSFSSPSSCPRPSTLGMWLCSSRACTPAPRPPSPGMTRFF